MLKVRSDLNKTFVKSNYHNSFNGGGASAQQGNEAKTAASSLATKDVIA